MSRKEVQDSIEELRARIDASAIGLIDLRTYRSSDGPPDSVAEALGFHECLRINWEGWCRSLESAGERTETCNCGDRHQLHGTVIDGRWALVMLVRQLFISEGTFEPRKALAYAEWVLAVGVFLEDESSQRRVGSRGDGGGGAGPAELGIPLSWHRKSHG
jgi:hypothetical protein